MMCVGQCTIEFFQTKVRRQIRQYGGSYFWGQNRQRGVATLNEFFQTKVQPTCGAARLL